MFTTVYNTQVHDSTEHSTFELAFAQIPKPLFLQRSKYLKDREPQEVNIQFLSHLHQLISRARETLAKAQQRYKWRYDAPVFGQKMREPGTYVYLCRHVCPKKAKVPGRKTSTKLRRKLKAHFEVLRNKTGSRKVLMENNEAKERYNL